jgi:adenine-specific DNA-methyltransferase
MEKLKLHSPNLTEANIEKIAELFPSCVVEAKDDKGELKQKIDFDQLRQELSDSIVEGPQERYRLDWPGKRESLLAANSPIAKTLRPCREESVDFDTTQNLFIEGDNLEALKLLQETYLGKVKMIYIDPPYNTGNDFIYEDNFAEGSEEYLLRSNQRNEAGIKLTANTDSNGRFHSDWLSMMYQRISLAKNLLSEDGIILISIDDNEITNVRKICDQVLGEERFISQLIWKSRQNKDNRTQNGVSTDHEYVLAYGKKFRGADRNLSSYSNPDSDPRGDWASANMVGLATADRRPNLHYDLIHPQTGINYGCPEMGWRYDQNTMQRLIKEERILWPSSESGRPRRKSFVSDLTSEKTGYSSIIGSGIFTRNGTADIMSLFEKRVMDFPKPVQLIKDLVQQATEPDSIVLDFFAGSSTTAHAVMEQNLADNGSRRFIMVQLAEETDKKTEAYKSGYYTIPEVSKERIRRAGKKIKDENATTAAHLDIGFRVLKIDTSNAKDIYYTPDAINQEELALQVDHIKEDRTAEDLLFQVMLDWGVDLALPIARESIQGKDVYFVDENAIAACFDTKINEAFVKELAKREPLRVVFRDSCFESDSAKINVAEIFKLLSPNTDIKTI